MTKRKAHCPTCDGERICKVHGSIYKPWDYFDHDGYNLMNGGKTHSLLECRGCETVFYEINSWNSEEVDQWYDSISGEERSKASETISTYPKPDSKTKPVWVDDLANSDLQLHKILDQMYLALDNRSRILASIGLRTALDRATEVLGILPSLSFDDKLDELVAGGWIGSTEREILGVVTDAGSAAAHRGWSPNGREVQLLVSAFEVFLQRAFIVGKDALSIREKIPARPKRANAKQIKAALKDSSAS